CVLASSLVLMATPRSSDGVPRGVLVAAEPQGQIPSRRVLKPVATHVVYTEPRLSLCTELIAISQFGRDPEDHIALRDRLLLRVRNLCRETEVERMVLPRADHGVRPLRLSRVGRLPIRNNP